MGSEVVWVTETNQRKYQPGYRGRITSAGFSSATGSGV